MLTYVLILQKRKREQGLSVSCHQINPSYAHTSNTSHKTQPAHPSKNKELQEVTQRAGQTRSTGQFPCLDLERRDWREPGCDGELQNRRRCSREERSEFNTKRRSACPGRGRPDPQNSSLGLLVVDVQSQTRQKKLPDSY